MPKITAGPAGDWSMAATARSKLKARILVRQVLDISATHEMMQLLIG